MNGTRRNHTNVRGGDFFPVKAVDKFFWLWSEKGWREEISHCSCPNGLSLVHLTDWWHCFLSLHTNSALKYMSRKINRTLQYSLSEGNLSPKSQKLNDYRSGLGHLHASHLCSTKKAWRSILMLMWIHQLHHWHIRLHCSSRCMYWSIKGNTFPP